MSWKATNELHPGITNKLKPMGNLVGVFSSELNRKLADRRLARDGKRRASLVVYSNNERLKILLGHAHHILKRRFWPLMYSSRNQQKIRKRREEKHD